MDEILTRTISLCCGIDHAFDVFTTMTDLWWPRGHRKFSDGTLHLDARPDGALVDRGPDGTEWTMAVVRAVEPPALLVLDWYPGSPESPTSVEIRFSESAGDTQIVVTHRPLSDSRSIWSQCVALFDRGWSAVLESIKVYVED